MKTVTTVAGFLLAVSAFAGGSDPKVPAPAYPLKAETNFIAKVADMREVGKESALAGIYLSVTNKNGETVNVYVGPKEFVKLFDVTFKVGLELEITGAKVKFDGGDVILSREIKFGRITLTLRDEDGWPNWDYNKPRGRITTGL